jgi:hypothetical protein
LYHYKPAQVLQQVRWLARVLAGRGMPSLLLQAQLEILVAELVASFPERKCDFEKLLPGAAHLGALRRKHLSDEQLKALGLAFDQAVGAHWRARLPDTGILLACAVADELEGSPGAVSSLQAWLTDAARFPAPWIEAVAATLALARQQAGKPK